MTPPALNPLIGIFFVTVLLAVQGNANLENELIPKQATFQTDTLNLEGNKETLYKRTANAVEEPNDDVKAMIALIDKTEMKKAAQYCDDSTRCKDPNVFEKVIKLGFKGFDKNFKQYFQFIKDVYFLKQDTHPGWSSALFTLVYKLRDRDEWLHTDASMMIGHFLYASKGLRETFQNRRNKHANLLRVFHDTTIPKTVKFLLDYRNDGAQLCGESKKHFLKAFEYGIPGKKAGKEFIMASYPDNLKPKEHKFYYAEERSKKPDSWFYTIPIKFSVVASKSKDPKWKYVVCHGDNCPTYGGFVLWKVDAVGYVLKIGSSSDRFGIIDVNNYLLYYEDKAGSGVKVIKNSRENESKYFYICNADKPLGWFNQ